MAKTHQVQVITKKDLKELPEYSMSDPTEVVIGKKWRRDIHAYRFLHNLPPVEPEWMICEYVPGSRPDTAKVIARWAVDANHNVHRGALEFETV